MKNVYILLGLLLLLIMQIPAFAKTFVAAKVSLNGEVAQAYDLVNEPVKIYSQHGMFEYSMDSIKKLWRSETGAVVHVETVAGDKIDGNLITENLQYLFFDKKKWIEINEDVLFNIDLPENEAMSLPADYKVVQLKDGSIFICHGKEKDIEIQVDEQEFDLPLSSVKMFSVEQKKTVEESEESNDDKDVFQILYAGGRCVKAQLSRRFEKLDMMDYFGHRLELPIDSIVKIDGALYDRFAADSSSVDANNTVHFTLKDGREEKVELPFCFFEFVDTLRNEFHVPSFYVKSIETRDGETVLQTIFGDKIFGQLNNETYHLLIPGKDTPDAAVEVSTDNVAELKFPEKAIEHAELPMLVWQGQGRIAGGFVSEVPVKISGDAEEMFDLSLNSNPVTLMNRDDTWYMYNEEYPDGIEVAVDVRSLDYVAFCDGSRQSLRLREIDRIDCFEGFAVSEIGETEVESVNEGGAETTVDKTGSGRNPRMRPGHVLQIHVLVAGETEIDEPERRITSFGEISLPLLGAVKVDTFTLEELEAHLVECYKEYLRDPQVVVQYVMNEENAAVSPWGSVTVLGTVNEPGKVNIPPTQDLTVSMAVQQAGGFDQSANDKAIKVTRMVDGQTMQYDVNLRNVGARGATGEDMLLQPGDVVYVPEMIF